MVLREKRVHLREIAERCATLRRDPSGVFSMSFLPAAVTDFIASHIDLIKAAILGMVEGLTEFLPVSSTGHLLLMQQFIGCGDDDFGKSFAILIQLGAILALLTIYFGRLWPLALDHVRAMAGARASSSASCSPSCRRR